MNAGSSSLVLLALVACDPGKEVEGATTPPAGGSTTSAPDVTGTTPSTSSPTPTTSETSTPTTPTVPVDADGDGYTAAAGDCDDADPLAFPGGPEVCDGKDGDCDGAIDADAAGTDACARTNSFVAGPLQVDVLLVIDDSCSMAEEQQRLADASFGIGLALDGVDAHVGVVTTDMDNLAKSGKLQPRDGKLWTDPADPLDYRESWLMQVIFQGTGGSGQEQGLEAIEAALDSALTGGDNAGFLRVGADLAVIVVSDESDVSKHATVGGIDAYLQANFTGDISVHAFATPPMLCPSGSSSGQAYFDLAALYGGLQDSVCDADWAPEVATIAAGVVPEIAFTLTDTPDVATIVVTVVEPDGTVVIPLAPADWEFDAVKNELRFTGYVPPAGSAVTVDYRAAP